MKKKKLRKEAIRYSLKMRRKFQYKNLSESQKTEKAKKCKELSKIWRGKGRNAEEIIKKAWEKLGWKVIRLMEEKHGYYYLAENKLKKFLKITTEKKINKRAYEKELYETLVKLNKDKNALPDFLMRKKGRIILIEVKNWKNKRSLSNIRQKDSIKLLEKKGFEVQLFNLPVKSKMSKKEIKKEVKLIKNIIRY